MLSFNKFVYRMMWIKLNYSIWVAIDFLISMRNLSWEYLSHSNVIWNLAFKIKIKKYCVIFSVRNKMVLLISILIYSSKLWNLGTCIPSSRRHKTSPIFEKKFLPVSSDYRGLCVVPYLRFDDRRTETEWVVATIHLSDARRGRIEAYERVSEPWPVSIITNHRLAEACVFYCRVFTRWPMNGVVLLHFIHIIFRLYYASVLSVK